MSAYAQRLGSCRRLLCRDFCTKLLFSVIQFLYYTSDGTTCPCSSKMGGAWSKTKASKTETVPEKKIFSGVLPVGNTFQ